MESKQTKQITIYQHAYTSASVSRVITIDVPILLETENISEERLGAIVNYAIEAGIVSGEQTAWHCNDEYFLVDENEEEINSEIIEVV